MIEDGESQDLVEAEMHEGENTLYPMHEIDDVPPHLPEVGMFASTDMPDARENDVLHLPDAGMLRSSKIPDVRDRGRRTCVIFYDTFSSAPRCSIRVV